MLKNNEKVSKNFMLTFTLFDCSLLDFCKIFFEYLWLIIFFEPISLLKIKLSLFLVELGKAY